MTRIRGVVIDLDGTVYRGGSLVPGADAAIDRLRDRGCRVVFCSNNPTKTPAEYVDRLAGMGIDADESAIVPASTATRDYLREHHPDDRTFLLGADSLRGYLADAGQRMVDAAHEADVFVASWDRTFDYDAMIEALRGIDEETAFVGTDPDRTIPTDDGEVPGSGAILGAVAATVDREPDRVLGKPSQATADAVLDRVGAPAGECLVVGDRLDTDLAMGDRCGMRTALVLSGVSDRSDAEASDVDPDFVLDSLADVDRALE